MLVNALNQAFYPSRALSWRHAFLLAVVASPFAFAGFCGLYLMKSALGINLMPGPSPLHDVLYWMLS